MNCLSYKLIQFKLRMQSFFRKCRITEWDDFPIPENSNDFIKRLPENVKINKDTKLEFHKHNIKDNKNIVEKIDVKYKIISENGYNYVVIHNYKDFTENNIDIHFMIINPELTDEL